MHTETKWLFWIIGILALFGLHFVVAVILPVALIIAVVALVVFAFSKSKIKITRRKETQNESDRQADSGDMPDAFKDLEIDTPEKREGEKQ